jgi:cell division protein FtsN
MKTFVKALMVIGLVGLIGITFAQDNKVAKKKANPAAGLLKKVDDLDLTAEQKEKIEAIKKEHVPKVEAAAKKVNDALTPEQRKARQEAQKAAKQAGKKGKEAEAEAIAAMKLTEEQKKAYDAAQKELTEATNALRSALASVLTDEQKSSVGLANGKKKKNQ